MKCEEVVFICVCICISLIWKYAFGGRRGGVDFVSLSLSSSPPLQLFRRRTPSCNFVYHVFVYFLFVVFIILFLSRFALLKSSWYPVCPYTLLNAPAHQPQGGASLPPLTSIYHEPIFLIYFRCICGFVPHLCGEMQSVEK